MDEMKKYIIELPENTYGIQRIMEGTKDHHPYMDYKQVEDLTPYTEPDMEQVREEAYEKGFDAGRMLNTGKYEKGLNDAWECARKICCYEIDGGHSVTQMLDLFDRDDLPKILSDYTASEAIEKIRAYEQEREEFHVGDEFEIESGKRFVIVKMDGTEIDKYIDEEGQTYGMYAKYNVMRKTGRHFPEITEVLRKMKGEN